MTHEERLAIAAELARRIVDTSGDAVLAVFITSSTAKGLDREHSDLEISAVVRDGVEIEGKSYVYRGVLIEIDYPRETRLLQKARRRGGRWPVEADGYRSRLVLFERDGWLRRLDAAVAESDAQDVTRALQHAATMVIESRDKVRNARLEGDRLDFRVQAYWTADAANLVLLLNGRYMITTRWYYRHAFECPQQPADFRQRIEMLVGIVPTTDEEIAGAAESLTDVLVAMVTARGVAVESPDLVV
mgnify:CR=1 FL=1